MESRFTGSLLELVIVNLVAGFFSAISLGLLFPWAICFRYRYIVSHTIIDGNQLHFDGTAAGLWGQWFKWLFFIIITVGIYTFWVGLSLQQWRVNHTHMMKSKVESSHA